MSFSLGPIERWAVIALAGLLAFAGKAAWNNAESRAIAQAEQYAALYDKISAVVTQQAVQTGQMQTLTTQLADVPRLNRDNAETKIRVERLEQDVRKYHGRD